MKIMTVVGARPQFVKAAVVSRAIHAHSYFQEIIVHTGQHYDHNMSDLFFEEMEIPRPKYNLEVGSSSHGASTGIMLKKLEEVMLKENPDIVILYGDTNSTLGGALAAAKLHIPIAHVEAGIRSHNRKMAEEVNRVLTDQVSRWCLCPTEFAATNLPKEGIEKDRIFVPGDVMYDAVLYYADKKQPTDEVKSLVEGANGYYICTCHRAENTDDPHRLRAIFTALNEISGTHPVILPIHPRTKKILAELNIKSENIKIIPPVGYFDMLYLTKNSRAVITDSGGMQKEAYFFEKPGLILRDDTEWPELIEAGTNQLVGADTKKILGALAESEGKTYDFSKKLFGDGKAGEKILSALLK